MFYSYSQVTDGEINYNQYEEHDTVTQFTESSDKGKDR